MARYTVTGGAGFIGSHLTEELLLVDGLAIVDRIPVAARARVW